MTAKRGKNRVFPNNKNIKFWYFLINISDPLCGHVGYTICEQAYVGEMTTKKENHLYRLVAEQCELNSAKSGMTHHVIGSGTRSFCETMAAAKWWLWTT